MSENIKQQVSRLDIEGLIKAVILGVLLYYAFAVIKPFIIPVL